jgi:hypothetical protein
MDTSYSWNLLDHPSEVHSTDGNHCTDGKSASPIEGVDARATQGQQPRTPSAAIASLAMNSLMLDRMTARPSARLL